MWFWQVGQPALTSERPEPHGKTQELGHAGGGDNTYQCPESEVNATRDKACRPHPLSGPSHTHCETCRGWELTALSLSDWFNQASATCRPLEKDCPWKSSDTGKHQVQISEAEISVLSGKGRSPGHHLPYPTPCSFLGSSLQCPLLPSPSLSLHLPPRLNLAASSSPHLAFIFLGFLPCFPCPDDLSLAST